MKAVLAVVAALALAGCATTESGSGGATSAGVVKITPLGSHDGEFCPLDRALVFEDPDGTPLTNVEHGREIRLRVEFEVLKDSPGLGVGFILANADGTGVFQFGTPVKDEHGAEQLAAGQRVTVAADVENLLVPGRYFVHCGVSRVGGAGVALYAHDAIDFVVFGGETQPGGVVSLPHQIGSTVEDGSSG